MDIERHIARNLRIVRIGEPIQRVESELIIIKRIAFTLLLNLLDFTDDQIILCNGGDSKTVLTTDEAVAFLHLKVQPVINDILKSSPRGEEDMKRIPDHDNCLLHLTKYLNSVEETERLLHLILRFSKFIAKE
jgi:hypothetical protein